MSRAFVFPGQGAQTIGMGRALADAYPAAKAVFDEVDAALGEKLSALIWEGDIAELTLTQNAQPALMATSLAALRALDASLVPLDRLMGESDFVVVACLLTDETRHLIGAKQFALMKPDAYFINVARGPIVDEPALIGALRAGIEHAGAGILIW